MIESEKNNFPYSVIRSKRKTIGIIVNPDSSIVVRVPNITTEEEIKIIIEQKRKWIANQIKKTEEIIKPVPKMRELVSGEKFRLKNRIYRLKVHQYQKKRHKLTFVAGIIHVYVYEQQDSKQQHEEIKKTLLKWYKAQAKKIILKRIENYNKYLPVKHKAVHIREQQTRWGSCTKDGILNFNWKIVIAPIPAIDYVVVHELCHLQESTHSTKFWDLVESLFPDYKKWKEWLRIYGNTLEFNVE